MRCIPIEKNGEATKESPRNARCHNMTGKSGAMWEGLPERHVIEDGIQLLLQWCVTYIISALSKDADYENLYLDSSPGKVHQCLEWKQGAEPQIGVSSGECTVACLYSQYHDSGYDADEILIYIEDQDAQYTIVLKANQIY